MNFRKITYITPFLFLVSCTSTNQDSISYDSVYPENTVRKYNDCYNASIALHKSLKDSKKIISEVTQNLDAVIVQDKEDQYIVKRKHHIGLVVGNGGETISFNLKKLDTNKTFITIDTKRDLVGLIGQKAWSCEIATQIKNKN